jgi:hypothetical protein
MDSFGIKLVCEDNLLCVLCEKKIFLYYFTSKEISFQ